VKNTVKSTETGDFSTVPQFNYVKIAQTPARTPVNRKLAPVVKEI